MSLESLLVSMFASRAEFTGKVVRCLSLGNLIQILTGRNFLFFFNTAPEIVTFYACADVKSRLPGERVNLAKAGRLSRNAFKIKLSKAQWLL